MEHDQEGDQGEELREEESGDIGEEDEEVLTGEVESAWFLGRL